MVNPKCRCLPLVFLVVAIVLSYICVTPAESALEGKKQVLILNSYHQGYKWTDDTTNGAIAALSAPSRDFKFYIEYMGTKWSNSKQYFEQLSRIYKEKFGAIRFDMIIATDNDAFDFLRRYRDEIFGEVPVVFCGVNWFKDEMLRGYRLYTGVNEDADIMGTLDVMLKLHPDTRNIYFVIDSTTTGHIIHEKILEIKPRYQNRLTFHFLENMTMDQILDTVGKVSDDSLVFLTIFQKDKAGTFFEFSDSTRLISQNSRVPVYGIWDFNLGFGIVGGQLTSGYEQGRNAGTLALQILNGTSPDAIPVIKKSPNKFMFDARQMARFNIKRSDLPQDSTVINEPVSFYTLNKGLVWGIIAGFGSLTMIVILLLANIRQRRQSEISLQRAHDELELRVEERTADLGRANQMLLIEIGERKRAEEKLNAAYTELKLAQSQIVQQEKMASIGTLAAGVAHEINNPMGFIISNLRSLDRYVDKFGSFIDLQDRAIESLSSQCPEQPSSDRLALLADHRNQMKIDYLRGDVASLIKESLDGAERVKKIVQDLKSFSRLDENQVKPADINEGVESTLNIIWNELKYKATVKREYGALPLTTCNQAQLNQVFMNILSNAGHAIEGTGEITIKTWADDHLIHVRISDTGAGMTREVLDRIFEPFYTTKEVGRGTGLGLSIAYDIIKKHHGSITVESIVGKGTTFTVTIPIVPE